MNEEVQEVFPYTQEQVYDAWREGCKKAVIEDPYCALSHPFDVYAYKLVAEELGCEVSDELRKAVDEVARTRIDKYVRMSDMAGIDYLTVSNTIKQKASSECDIEVLEVDLDSRLAIGNVVEEKEGWKIYAEIKEAQELYGEKRKGYAVSYYWRGELVKPIEFFSTLVAAQSSLIYDEDGELSRENIVCYSY